MGFTTRNSPNLGNTTRWLLAMAMYLILSPTTQAATSVSQHGITWFFDKDYEVGQFVNGDYYVVGPVNISRITPDPQSGRNGTQLNPFVGGSDGNPRFPYQPFDSRAYYYDESYLFRSGTVAPGTSIVTAISKTGNESQNWAGWSLSSNAFLWSAAVLTVLDSHPIAPSFRPPYSGSYKPLYTLEQVNWAVLANLGLSGIETPDVDYFLRGLERPWISTHGRDWTARTLSAENNQHDYHEEIGFFLSEASLLLLTDIDSVRAGSKEQLAIRFIQNAIDYYATVRVSGTETSAVWAWPLVLGGLLLDEPEIYNFWKNNPDKRTQRGHEKLYYIGDRSTSSSSIVPNGQTWVGWRHPESRKYPAFAKQTGEEYEHLHPSEWQCFEPHCKAEVYRAQHDIYPLVGMTLASILVDRSDARDVNSMLAHDPIRDYVDRWMDEGFMDKQYPTTNRTFFEEMQYHQPFTIYKRNYGSGGSGFIDSMWDSYRNSDDAGARDGGPVPSLEVN